MADLPIDTGGSVLDEGRHRYAAAIDTSGDFMHLPPKERRAAVGRRRRWRTKLRRAEQVRATWGPEDFESERLRLEREVQAMLAAREDGCHCDAA